MSEVRNLLRSHLRTAGMQSRDWAEMRPGVAVSTERELDRDGHRANGAHGWDGAVYLAPDRAARARSALDRLVRRKRLNAGDHSAIRTLVHEELHGVSPITKDAYVGFGAALEEATTEMLARLETSRLTGVDLTAGSYQDKIDRLVNAGRTVDRTPDDIIAAARAMRAPSHDAEQYRTPTSYLEGFARALGLAPVDAARFAHTFRTVLIP